MLAGLFEALVDKPKEIETDERQLNREAVFYLLGQMADDLRVSAESLHALASAYTKAR